MIAPSQSLSFRESTDLPLKRIEEGEPYADGLEDPAEENNARGATRSRRSLLTAGFLGSAAILAIGLGVFFHIEDKKGDEPATRNTDPTFQTEESLVEITEDQLLQHSDANDCWLAMHGHAYDLTNFEHPGGSAFINMFCGQEATKDFDLEHTTDLLQLVQSHIVGTFATKQLAASPAPSSSSKATENPTSAPSAGTSEVQFIAPTGSPVAVVAVETQSPTLGGAKTVTESPTTSAPTEEPTRAPLIILTSPPVAPPPPPTPAPVVVVNERTSAPAILQVPASTPVQPPSEVVGGVWDEFDSEDDHADGDEDGYEYEYDNDDEDD